MYVGPARAAEVQWQCARPWLATGVFPEYATSCHLTAAEACSQWTSTAARCNEAEYLGTLALASEGVSFCDFTQVGQATAAASSFWRPRPAAAEVNPAFFAQMPQTQSSITGSSRSRPSTAAAETQYWNPNGLANGGAPQEQADDGGGVRWTLSTQASLSWDIPDIPYVVQFDPYEELVWVGTLGGRLQSCVLQWHEGLGGPASGAAAISPFTRFVAHRCAICHLLFDERGVLSVGEDNLAYHQRGGMPVPFLEEAALSRMTANDNALRHAEWYGRKQLIVGSTQAKFFFVDVASGRLSATMDSPHGTQTMCSTTGQDPSYVIVGGNDGQISVVDRRKKSIVRTLQAHKSSVTAMTEQDGTLVTCGGSSDGQTGMFIPDGFLKVFDLRRFEQTMPVSFKGAAVQARFHPLVPNSLAILANSGAFQTCELSGGRVYNTKYMWCRSSLTDGAVGFDVSSSGECLAIADTSGLLQLWQSKGRPPKVNMFSSPVEVPPVRAQPLYPKLIDNLEHPLKAEPACPQGCPALREAMDGSPLLSMWTGDDKCMRAIRPPLPVHPDIAANLQMNGFVACAQNVKGWKRNAAVAAVLSDERCGPKERRALNSLSVSAESLVQVVENLASVDTLELAVPGLATDSDSPSDAVRGVEQLISEVGDDDGSGLAG